MSKQANQLYKAVVKGLVKNPTVQETLVAIDKLKVYAKTRREILEIFGESELEDRQVADKYRISRLPQVDQYFVIRENLEGIGVTFPGGKLDQAVSVKVFKLALKGDATARLYWSECDGWSVSHKTHDKVLSGAWEEFDFDDFCANNDIDLDQ